MPALLKRARRGVSRDRTFSLPAPVGGWNTRDPITEMPAKDAVELTNWFPRASDVVLRKGFSPYGHFTGFWPGVYTTVFTRSGRDLTGKPYNRLYAVCKGKVAIWDLNTNLPIGDIPDAFGVRDAVCTATNFVTDKGVSYTFLCNAYDGVNTADIPNSVVRVLQTVDVAGPDVLSPLTYYGVSTPPSTMGFAFPSAVPGGMGDYGAVGASSTWIAEITSISVACRRLWLTMFNNSSVYYLPVGQPFGTLSHFPLGPALTRGGSIVAIGTWTIDGGEGMDDYTVFASSEGELVVYKGYDPATSGAFQKVGVFYIAPPIGGANCLAKYGGELLYLSRNGVFPLSQALQSTTVNLKSALTDKIFPSFAEATTLYGDLPNWQVVSFAAENMLIVNVPTSDSSSEQYIMNTITGAWTRFTGIPAASIAVSGNRLFFAGTTSASDGTLGYNTIYRFWDGQEDTGKWTGTVSGSLPVLTPSQPISAKCRQAFNYFGVKGRQKRINMAQPVAIVSDNVNVTLGLDGDFRLESDWANNFYELRPPTGAGIALDWQTIPSRMFNAGSFCFNAVAQNISIKWTATNFAGEIGGIL